ncbi:MAG TPA: SOS response-associated peptidase [Gammaproteobacteria bacterium]|nr:SOS response-associated peptidase [Gammaproteobacteria bacterium]
MCGRYNLITDAEALVDFFDITRSGLDASWSEPHYNLAPGQPVPVVRAGPVGRELVPARWGLVPHWSKESRPKYSTINARAETVAEKPAYREAFRRKRCLIPATGFYEWKHTGEGKNPYHIRLAGGGLFAFAGLWDHWPKGDEGFDSCSIIVTDANAAMRPVHERMPVILNPALYNAWLNPAHGNRAQLQSMLVPWTGALEIYPVSQRVNSPKHNDAGCIRPVEAS